ncbi:amidohydrolase family protein [Pseudoxanthomonas winnipegensis]|nr:amidohydrolase family protein [Pseudoxanthomonas winnipegensis]
MVPLLLALALSSAPTCVAGVEPVIDIHIHSYERDGRFEARVPNPGDGQPMRVFNGADHARVTAAALREAGVVRAIVGGATTATDDRIIALDPTRLRGGFEIDDIPDAAMLDQIRARHAAGKLAMIGEVEYQYNGIAHDDPRLEPLWALAEELDVPIAVHSGAGPAGIVYRGQPLHRERLGNPSSFEEVLVRHPRMKLIILHAGWPFLDDTVALLHAYPQVYVDLGAIDWAEPRPFMDHYLEQLMIYGFGKRVLFGSDQMVWPEATAQAIARFRTAPYLSDAQRRDIFFNNAVRLFGWTDLADCGKAGG